MPSRIVPNSAAASAWRVIPYRSAAATQMAPTAASTMGYCREIGSPQRRQRPFKSSHETTGMLSRQAMGCLQRGQVEGGFTSDMSTGSRTMHTFRKLPRQSPRIATATSRIGSTATRHLVEQNARRHRDVERLRALRQGNRHALCGDGVELRADPGPFVADDHRDGTVPSSHFLLRHRPVERYAVGRGRPQCDRQLPRPGDEPCVVERHDRVAEGRPHRGPQCLGARRVGGAAQHHRARGAQRVRRANQGADVPRVLHPVDHQRHGTRPRCELGRRPATRLDHRDDALRRLRVGELRERAGADLLHRHRVPLQLGHELHPPRRARQVGSDQGALERHTCRERLLHQSHALDQGELAPAACLAALEIADRRWQITGDGSPHGPSICREAADGRYVKIALTIAGSDSGGGAGVQADLKTFHQFGVFGTSVITAVTAQNTVGVRAWQALPAALVTKQIDALADDLPPAAVKSGMLASAELVETVAAGIAGRRLPNYVLDPVMLATSGDRLLNADAEHLIARRLVPLARLVTPNLGEAAILAGTDVRNPADMERAGRALVQLGAKAALVKGGHLAGDEIVDVLVSDGTVRRFTRARLDTTSTHGTGCTLSAAIAAGLAHGRPLERAVEDALDFVSRAMAAAPGLGKGHGPLNHFVPAPPRPPTNGL